MIGPPPRSAARRWLPIIAIGLRFAHARVDAAMWARCSLVVPYSWKCRSTGIENVVGAPPIAKGASYCAPGD